jgi:GTP-binding protein
LAQRESLHGLILIMDVRHPLTVLDQRLLAWVAPRRLPIHILLTKADKLSRGHALNRLQAVEKSLAETGTGCSVQLFSSHDGSGVEAARGRIAAWLQLPANEKTGAQNKNPRLKGSKAGGKNALIGIKAPAQGGEAGDDAEHRLGNQTDRALD